MESTYSITRLSDDKRFDLRIDDFNKIHRLAQRCSTIEGEITLEKRTERLKLPRKWTYLDGKLKYECDNLEISRSQRKNERARGEDDMGTILYERVGCYQCEGRDPTCKSYHQKLKLNPRATSK